MRTLIAYGTRYGATEKVANAMEERLKTWGEAKAQNVKQIDSLDPYTHLILGSPLYDDDLLPEVKVFIQRFNGVFGTLHLGVFAIALGHYGEGLYGNKDGGLAYFDRYSTYLSVKPVYMRVLLGELKPDRLNDRDHALIKEYWQRQGVQEIPYETQAELYQAWDYVEKFVEFSALKERVEKRLEG